MNQLSKFIAQKTQEYKLKNISQGIFNKDTKNINKFLCWFK